MLAPTGQDIKVGRLRRIDTGCVELQPESTNPKHRSIRIDAQTKDKDIEIVGVVVGADVRVRGSARQEPDQEWDL